MCRLHREGVLRCSCWLSFGTGSVVSVGIQENVKLRCCVMKNCRIEKTYEVIGRDALLAGREIGGLYPGVKLDDEYFRKLGAAESAPELQGLQPEGFVPGSRFEVTNFDLEKLAEIRETALNYFCVIDGCDCESDLESVLALVRELHSAPESVTKGRLMAGELIFALWLADVPFTELKVDGCEDTIVFGVDWDEISDPANYIDNDHGFENLLRPSSAWFPADGPRVSVGGGVEFLSLNPKVEEEAL